MAINDIPVDRGTVVEEVRKKPYAVPVLVVLDTDRTATGALGAQADGTNSTTATVAGS